MILIDTYEALTPLDNWLRTIFLPQLPDTVLTVLAGRNSPDVAWQGDSGWQDLVRVISLRNLSQEEGALSSTSVDCLRIISRVSLNSHTVIL